MEKFNAPLDPRAVSKPLTAQSLIHRAACDGSDAIGLLAQPGPPRDGSESRGVPAHDCDGSTIRPLNSTLPLLSWMKNRTERSTLKGWGICTAVISTMITTMLRQERSATYALTQTRFSIAPVGVRPDLPHAARSRFDVVVNDPRCRRRRRRQAASATSAMGRPPDAPPDDMVGPSTSASN